MKLKVYKAGGRGHWGKSFRLEWGDSSFAVVLQPHPRIWIWRWWNSNTSKYGFMYDYLKRVYGSRWVGLYVGPIGFIYVREGKVHTFMEKKE